MKKLITIALCGLAFPAMAQKFEGAISWSASYTLTNKSVEDKALQYLPTKYTFKGKDGNYVIDVEGTPRPMEMLWLGSKEKGYKLDPAQKRWSVITPMPAAKPGEQKAAIINTGETADILGYPCTKYIIRQADPRTSLEQVYWVTGALDGLSMQNDLANTYMGTTTTLFHKEIDGMPLRIQITTPTIRIVVEAISVKKEPLPASDFSIPGDFVEVK